MNAPSETVRHALRVLRRRVRYEDAHLTLGDHFMSNDTPAIREATRLYVESWIIPIIDMIETGDTAGLKQFTRTDRGTNITEEVAS